MPAGVERRAFVVGSSSHSGALSGVVELSQQLRGNTLRLALQFDLVPYAEGTMISAPEEETLISRHGSAKMIDKIYLKRGGHTLPAAYTGTRNGYHLYQVNLDQADLSNLYLHVDFRYIEDLLAFDFDLFNSDYARNLQRARSRAGGASKVARVR